MSLICIPTQIGVCVCICTSVTLFVVTGTASRVTAGVQCFCQMSVAKHKEQENCHLCPTFVSTSNFASVWLAAETHVVLAQPSNGQPEWLRPKLWNSTKNVLSQCDEIAVMYCLLFTMWGRNLAGVTRFFIRMSDKALNLFHKWVCGPFVYLLFISFGRLTLSSMLCVLRWRSYYTSLLSLEDSSQMFPCFRCPD